MSRHEAAVEPHHASPGRRTNAHHRPKTSAQLHHNQPKAPSVDKTFNTMEKTMDDEVETVLRDWNENVKRRERETFQVRPLRVGSGSQRGAARNTANSERSFGENDPKAKLLNIERITEKEDASDDQGIDSQSSSESLQEEDMKRPMYVTCPRTGRKIVRMQFDVHGFDSKEIKVKAVNRKVIIFAVHKETDSGRKSTNEFCRKINLPDDVDLDRLQCTFSCGVLCLEAPVFVRPTSSLSGSRQSITSTTPRTPTEVQAPLNQPFVKASEMGQVMHINVEVGRVFRADDVVVKLRGNDKLMVTAAREEDNDHNSLSASLKREFRLPRRIHPHSLRAGLTNDGILNVTAIIDEAVLSNGVVTNTVNTANTNVTTNTATTRPATTTTAAPSTSTTMQTPATATTTTTTTTTATINKTPNNKTVTSNKPAVNNKTTVSNKNAVNSKKSVGVHP